MHRVVVVSEVFRLHPAGIAKLAAAGFEPVARHDLATGATRDRQLEALSGACAVVAGGEPYPAAVLAELPSLRAVARPGVGVDAIDVERATELGIAVLTTPATSVESVADHAVALMLAVCRRVIDQDQSMRAAGWRTGPVGRDLAGGRVGIVGLGAIGRAVARRLSGFGCRLQATDPFPDVPFCDAYQIELKTLEDLVADNDIVTLHVPLQDSTRHLIDASIIGHMRPGAVLVNTSRGAAVDEGALVAALASGHLGGAGLDVFEREPVPPGHPLLAFRNVVMTPHIASFTGEALARMVDATIANLTALFAGDTPPGCVNPESLAVRRED